MGTTPTADWVEALAESLPGEGRREAALSFASRVPPGYPEQTAPEQAARDLCELAALSGPSTEPESESEPEPEPEALGQRFGGRHRLRIRPPGPGAGDLRLRRYGSRAVELSGLLPLLESFGLVVMEAVPFRVTRGEHGEPAGHIDDVGLRIARPLGAHRPDLDLATDGERLVTALEAVARADTDVDSLNRLVLAARLDWRQTAVLRAYRRYRRQTGGPLGDADLDDPLVEFPEVTAGLFAYFAARFEPGRGGRQREVESARHRVLDHLGGVPQLRQEQVLRGYLQLIDATARTNFYVAPRPGAPPGLLALKLDLAAGAGTAPSRRRVETFVHGAGTDGIHLRAGPVARGGIRWSERPLDLRTEVLHLAQAQVKKNAVIVPTGAKGGFVCRRPHGVTPADVEDSYRGFVRALLDITDNLVGGAVVTPPGVVAADGEDPYLVVAADRGTATFSDLANAISAEYGYWLGDAFASGGSHGYDHKVMGITARGAWVAVRRHFRQLGVDVQTEPVRVVGVGDLSGDVFGNGMLQSSAVRLVAAFDHRHIFLDPDPDPAASFAERTRIFGLARSSWDDYDRSAISPGGGVWPRHATRIPLAEAARRALGLDQELVTPPSLIAAILSAPVDLLWFGGIGTYVRHPDEADTAVGDPGNADVRVTADQIRARVVAEGANLGVTQAGRIRYSRRGGRINADFIDNAAGVATSDREVNLKILLSLAIDEGRLAAEERDAVLAEVEGDVAKDVLRLMDRSVAALSRAVPASARELDAYEALLESLERAGHVDRSVEALPDPGELAVRRAAGAGLIRPELAVLLAFSKLDLVQHIEASALVAGPTLAPAVRAYFPPATRHRFGDLTGRHRLYPQLAATALAGEVVDQMGIVWAHETAAQLGRDVADAAGAFWAATRVLGSPDRVAELEGLAPGLSDDAENELHAVIVGATGRLARTYLTRTGPIVPDELVAADRPALDAAAQAGLADPGHVAVAEEALVRVGVDRPVARRFLRWATLARIGDAGMVSRATGRPAAEVLATFTALDRAAGLDRLEDGLRRAPCRTRWADWQARALRDDVGAWRRRAAHHVLGAPDHLEADHLAPDQLGDEPELAVRRWADRQAPALARARALLDGDPPEDWSTVAFLALRALGAAL